MRFKVWLEQKEQNDKRIRGIYKAVEKRFVGEVGDLSDPLSKVGESEFGKQRGSKRALSILDKMGVLDKLNSLGGEWSSRVADTKSYLQSSTKLGTVGDLLKKLFGDKHGQFRSKDNQRPSIKTKPPRNDSTEQVPGGQEQPMPPQQPPGPPMGGGGPGMPPPQMGGMPPMGGQPGMPPPQPGM